MVSKAVVQCMFALCVFLACKVQAQYNMHFFLPDFPPYTTTDKHGNAVGIGLEAVLPILDTVGVNYSIQVGSNHGRALSELRGGRSDGFFMASKNAQRDEYAVFSNSVMINRWVWVVLRKNRASFKPSDKSRYVMASLLNTNTNYWLKKSGYKTVKPASDIHALVSKLVTKEVDAILVAEAVFNSEFKYDVRFQLMTQKETEFGIYISKAFLKDHPEFMDKLNKAIQQQR
ncbi:substrate-binding periplasmic protein [Vibrio marisflavi]|uniref:Solute-binding protein family 3/N-terminal domain-containing protein n=1 Tax=Vibrio marisflavi CECT 7928 TaxID=634439 RepID=A0ABM9A0R2_9VIBR|nr:transporter substrate-binding domain-containing protein [Vibrio marisflavi]CAH0537090.1 hypothetical protein VMF7928_00926 [Vibrio marisflavi CECT 7928]